MQFTARGQYNRVVRCSILLVIAALCVSAQVVPPLFEDYPVEERFTGKPADPLIVTPAQRLYRTRIREGVSKGWGVIRDGKEQPGPNFAGHYVIVEWGCGVPCVMMAMVDAGTGQIYALPLSSVLGLPFFGLRSAEVNFRLTSRLLTIDACPEQAEKLDAMCYTHYFLWEKDKWTLLRRVRIASPLFDAQ